MISCLAFEELEGTDAIGGRVVVFLLSPIAREPAESTVMPSANELRLTIRF